MNSVKSTLRDARAKLGRIRSRSSSSSRRPSFSEDTRSTTPQSQPQNVATNEHVSSGPTSQVCDTDDETHENDDSIPEFKLEIRRPTTLMSIPDDASTRAKGKTQEKTKTKTEFTLSPSEIDSVRSIRPLYSTNQEKSTTLNRLEQQDSTLLLTPGAKKKLTLLKRSLASLADEREVEGYEEDLKSVGRTIEALLGNKHGGLRGVGVQERNRLKDPWQRRNKSKASLNSGE